jgi:hypothetical protein
MRRISNGDDLSDALTLEYGEMIKNGKQEESNL